MFARIGRRAVALLLAMACMCMPLMHACAENDFTDFLSQLSQDELLILREQLEEELERRGGGGLLAALEPTVWIPKSGSKYHRTPTCSNMKNPIEVTISEAITGGYEPCKRCKP